MWRLPCTKIKQDFWVVKIATEFLGMITNTPKVVLRKFRKITKLTFFGLFYNYGHIYDPEFINYTSTQYSKHLSTVSNHLNFITMPKTHFHIIFTSVSNCIRAIFTCGDNLVPSLNKVLGS